MNELNTGPVAESASRQRGRTYTLLILMLVYAFNHIDRQVLIILQEDIQREFSLSDSQLGLLTGILFAAFYSTLGIPAAIWADRGNRKTIITIALAIWSGMTALSGMAMNFIHIALARMGVAVGEAGCTPPATSIIADLYPPKERATAMGIYTLGIGVGVLVGLALGDFVADRYGWRVAFFVAGIPGLVLAVLVWFTVREPERGASEARRTDEIAPSVSETFGFILTQPSFVALLIGCTLICISANAFLAWVPVLMGRTYSFADGELGLALGLLIGGFGCAGAILIGMITDRLSARSLSWRPLIIAVCGGVSIPFVFFALGAETKWAFYLLYIVPSFVGLIYASIAYTAAQELVSVRMRAFAAAFSLLCLTLLGIGLGPWVTGLISDMFLAQMTPAGEGGGFSPVQQADALRRALYIILGLNVLSIPPLLLSARTYVRDVARAAEGLSARAFA
ncbi:MAG: MFS transporter [Hyphomonadaceae bacterium]|nr:MFS transporter [Hyphomonadaceae bacterium]